MVKATNPNTGVSEFVTAEQADKMRKSLALKGYQFKIIEEAEPVEPPAVNMPETLASASPAEDVPNPLDDFPEGIYETPFGKIQVTKPAKRRK